MDGIAKDTIAILQYLLPGFLAAWVFYGFTSYSKPSQFERVIQALIFTVPINALVYSEKLLLFTIGERWRIGQWSEESDLISSALNALIIGILISYYANNDRFHAFWRKIGVSTEPTFPTEWIGVFRKNTTYVVLHLKDDRRLFGWPEVWPANAGNGHFDMQYASWIVDGKNYELPRVKSIMISAEGKVGRVC